MPDELYGAILLFVFFLYILKQVPIYFRCLGECCITNVVWPGNIFSYHCV